MSSPLHLSLDCSTSSKSPSVPTALDPCHTPSGWLFGLVMVKAGVILEFKYILHYKGGLDRPVNQAVQIGGV